MTEESDNRGGAKGGPAGAPVRNVIRSADLFRHGPEVAIEHEGDFYRLRLTSKGKLILTK